jgi:hypothetical protein
VLDRIRILDTPWHVIYTNGSLALMCE